MSELSAPTILTRRSVDCESPLEAAVPVATQHNTSITKQFGVNERKLRQIEYRGSDITWTRRLCKLSMPL